MTGEQLKELNKRVEEIHVFLKIEEKKIEIKDTSEIENLLSFEAYSNLI